MNLLTKADVEAGKAGLDEGGGGIPGGIRPCIIGGGILIIAGTEPGTIIDGKKPFRKITFNISEKSYKAEKTATFWKSRKNQMVCTLIIRNL